MRAMAVFPERREVRIVELPAPTATRARDVTVRVREVGICGTDREISHFGYGTPPAGSEFLVIGHEAIGEVVAVGPSVRTLERGDLVAITVRRPCDVPDCVACRAGRQDFCVTGQFHERGIKDANGYMTELVVEDERYLVKVPHTLADVAVLIEPLTIAAKAAIEVEVIGRRYPWEPTDLRALVLGAGPIGLLGAMMLVSRNLRTVVYSREPESSERAELVRSLGAVYLSSENATLDEVSSRGDHFDVIFEAVGTARVAFAALAALAPNGIYIFSGVPGGRGQPIEMNLDGIMRNLVLRNQVLLGTVNASRAAFDGSIRQLEQFMTLFPDAVRRLITQRVRLEDACELLRTPGGIKQVVTMAA
jgi:glucose 1-dehydrogenase